MFSTVLMLVRMHVRSQMEYRAAFVMDRVAQILSYGAAFSAIWVLLNRFHTLGGWRWPEMALLLSFQLLAYSLGAALSFVQFRDLEDLVRLGTFDALLVRPIHPWVYLTFSGLNIGYLGHVILAVGLMAWALVVADVDWTIWKALYFLGALISASMVVAAVMTMIGVSALVLVQSSYLYSIFFGFWELTRYPMNIYPAALQWVLVTVVPLGFMNYVPVAVFLGKDVALLGAWGGTLSLLAGPVAAVAAILHWRWCLVRYQGGGG
jgi:ABC-2 type transport system permease protein